VNESTIGGVDKQEVRVEGVFGLSTFTAQCTGCWHTRALEPVQHCQHTDRMPRGAIRHRFNLDQMV